MKQVFHFQKHKFITFILLLTGFAWNAQAQGGVDIDGEAEYNQSGRLISLSEIKKI